MNNINSLYELIKQKSKEKSRPLKIVADWDDCLQPLKPLAVYKMSKNINTSFKEFFKRFWEIAVFSHENPNKEQEINTSIGKIIGVNGSEEEKKVFDEYLDSLKVVHDYDQGERLDKEIKKLENEITKAQGEAKRELEIQKEVLIQKKQKWESEMQGKKKEQGIYWKNYYRSPEWIETINN